MYISRELFKIPHSKPPVLDTDLVQLQASTPIDKTTNSTDGIAEYTESRYTYSYLTY